MLVTWVKTLYRVFSLTWPASMQIYRNKRKRLHKKRVQLPEDWFGTPTWPPWRHVKTLYSKVENYLSNWGVSFPFPSEITVTNWSLNTKGTLSLRTPNLLLKFPRMCPKSMWNSCSRNMNSYTINYKHNRLGLTLRSLCPISNKNCRKYYYPLP